MSFLTFYPPSKGRLSFVPPLAVASSLVLCCPHHDKTSWGAHSAVYSLYKATFRVVHEPVSFLHPCLYTPISVRGICPEERDGILTLSCDCCSSVEILREKPEGSTPPFFFDLNEKFAQQQLKIPIGKPLPSELLTFDIEVLTLLGCRFYSP